MADPIDHLATVRAALDLAGKATPGEWWQGAVERHHVFAERGNPSLIAPEAGRVLLRMSEHFPAYAHDAAAIVALRNAAPAIAALADECERLRAAVSALDLKVADTVRRWDEASDEERIRREAIERELADSDADRRRHFATLCRERDINMEARARIATLEAELAQARAHRCGGIVLSAEDADRIAALLEEQPGPTPAMLALFDKAKEE